MSHTLPLDLAQRVDTELAMLSFEITVVARFMWRVVDVTDGLCTLREDRSVFSQLLSLWDNTRGQVVMRGWQGWRCYAAVSTTATIWGVQQRLDVHGSRPVILLIQKDERCCCEEVTAKLGRQVSRLYPAYKGGTATLYDELRPNAKQHYVRKR